MAVHSLAFSDRRPRWPWENNRPERTAWVSIRILNGHSVKRGVTRFFCAQMLLSRAEVVAKATRMSRNATREGLIPEAGGAYAWVLLNSRSMLFSNRYFRTIFSRRVMCSLDYCSATKIDTLHKMSATFQIVVPGKIYVVFSLR
jgi:hypothetical protein